MCHVCSKIIVITILPNSGLSQGSTAAIVGIAPVVMRVISPLTHSCTSHMPQNEYAWTLVSCHLHPLIAQHSHHMNKGRWHHAWQQHNAPFAHLLLLFFLFSSNATINSNNKWMILQCTSLYQWQNITPNIIEQLGKYDRFVSFSNTWLAKKHHKMHAVLLPLSHRALGSWFTV
jgi:hypothetical protein